MAAARGNGAHTAGIFADMTVDGPEIGTLVVVFDRAKNLPNRRSMGKQNPYCAARLGKEAKKTETDVRGGQTPKWDQELRFTVHDSPDYQNLKISLFSEDKKTDLIGEAWVSLTGVVVPGGGKNDLWQGLSCKGRYAGELRIEMTYYDSRPKPEASQESANATEDVRPSGARVKRRPLPTNPVNGAITPDTIPGPPVPGRARHGPRDYRTPPQPSSIPPNDLPFDSHEALRAGPPYWHSPTYHPEYHTPPHHYPEHHVPYQQQYPHDDPFQQPNFLPQLPPTNRQRAQQAYMAPQPPRPHMFNGFQHAHSAPAVPMSQHPDAEDFDDSYHLRTDYPEPLPDAVYLHNQLHQGWQDPQAIFEEQQYDPYLDQQPYAGHAEAPPPPPPVHSNSSPAVPQPGPGILHMHSPSPSAARYGVSPSSTRSSYAHGSSPLYGHYQTPSRSQPGRGAPGDEYSPSPEQGPYVTPPNPVPGQTPSPASRASAARAVPYRHSVGDPYAYGTTPPRPHPLSQEMSRARSPQPFTELPGSSLHHATRDGPPLIKPRPVSPAPPRQETQSAAHAPGKSTYSIQHPVRAFESSDGSPLSTSLPRGSHQPPLRKSVSPRPTPPKASGSSMPFDPDSFDVHNPSARHSMLPNGNSPHSPYQIRPGTEMRDESRGPIVGWHGQEIDPSDHLPVDSWAPEPEKKTPTKMYGLGRDRDFGPRNVHGVTTANGRVSKDTVINVRSKTQPEPPRLDTAPSPEAPSSGRNKLIKKNAARSPVAPLGEHHNYNPASSPYTHSPSGGTYHGGYSSPYPGNSPSAGQGPPHVPPKIPMQYDYDDDALAREIQSIDIGDSRHRRGGSVPPPTAYQPVRSHRDRSSFY